MPSTAWNVFVASGVAIVVYFAVKMGQVLLGLAAGTILFLGGWLTGYAINHDLLDSIGLLRISVAGTVSGFVVFWTVVVVEGEFLTGLLVIGLVWFAAWFTSDMGPIKGETGAMATIDEPRPPEGPRPGTPLDLGGDSDVDADTGGKSILGGLRDLVSPPAPDASAATESTAPGSAEPRSDAEPDSDAGSSDDERSGRSTQDATGGGASHTTRDVQPSDTTSGQKESIFGLGIFYEGDPEGPTPAGADAAESASSTTTEPIDGDHTRPGVADGGATEAVEGAWTDGDSDAAQSDSIDDVDAETDVDSENDIDAEADVDAEDDDPPEEHRVDVDEGGFIFD